jgi:GT2 family glycosyltransferase
VKVEVKKVFIVVAVYNRINTTISFVRQVMAQSYQNIELIIVDDCSTDGTAEKVNELCRVWNHHVILRTKGSAWWGGCMYLGIDYILNNPRTSTDSLILLMNDDINFPINLVANFVHAANTMPDAVLGAVRLSSVTKIKSIGSNMVSWPFAISSSPFRGKNINNPAIPEFIPIDFQYGNATLYPIKVVRKIGNVAYKELPHYHGDGEYSYRAKKNGFASYVVKSIQLKPDINNTGLFNSLTNKHTLKEFFRSFYEFKSINNVRHRWQFAKLCCPRPWREIYFSSEILKSILRSIISIVVSRLKPGNTKL